MGEETIIIIIIIIKYIYIAQGRTMLQMHCVNSYVLYRNVFSLFLNMSSEMSGAHSSSGRLFQT